MIVCLVLVFRIIIITSTGILSDTTKIRRLIITATFICDITFNLIHYIQSFNVNWGTNFPAVQLNKTMQIVIVSILSDFFFFYFYKRH